MKKSFWLLLGGVVAGLGLLLVKAKGAGAAPTPIPSEPYKVIDQLYQAKHFLADANGYQTYLNFRTYFLGESSLDQDEARQMLEEARMYGWVDYTAYRAIYDMIYREG